jgi:LuxR family transcriptional regulator, maltose regulon positive regulatory protein
LYRGDYLLEDLYENWTMVERERLSNAYVDMLDRLAANYIEAGRPRDGIRAYYRALEKDRCHEGSHRLLMLCYARMGQRDRAIKQYLLCERVFCQSYGIEPSHETYALYRDLLRGDS